jgi:hypothetical protein
LDLKRQEGSVKAYRLFALISGLLVVGAIVWGFTVMGLPQSQRATQLDATRINDLQSIQSQITYYYQQKATVPATLNDLVDPISNYTLPTDPETDLAYQYEKVSSSSFKLCANFATSQILTTVRPALPKEISQNWQHQKGIFCFDRTIDPELYPVFKK